MDGTPLVLDRTHLRFVAHSSWLRTAHLTNFTLHDVEEAGSELGIRRQAPSFGLLGNCTG